jgi:hypothetical protein
MLKNFRFMPEVLEHKFNILLYIYIIYFILIYNVIFI